MIGVLAASKKGIFLAYWILIGYERWGMLNKIITVFVVLAAILFVVNGLRWIVDPAGIVGMFGLELASGVGLSSQVGDMSAFFLTLGVCMLLGVVTAERLWFYPAMLLLGLTAVGRVLAWLVHDAALATSLIALEVIITLLLWVASRRLREAQ